MDLRELEQQLDDQRLTTVGLLFEARDGLVAKFRGQLADHGLSIAEFDTLLRLARTPQRRLRMTDLASQLDLSPSGLSRLVDRLQAKGLLGREDCDSDLRGTYATITDTGAATLAVALDGHLALIDKWFGEPLSGADLKTLGSTLRKLRDNVHPGATAGAEPQPHPDSIRSVSESAP